MASSAPDSHLRAQTLISAMCGPHIVIMTIPEWWQTALQLCPTLIGTNEHTHPADEQVLASY
jgi:hypothetical protein